MFINKFIGGPLDGEERGATPDTVVAQRIMDQATGAVYSRDPEQDTDTARAWVPDGEPAGQQRHVASEDRDGITLGELRRFVEIADREGWPHEARLRALAGFRGRLFKIELRHRKG